MTLDELDKRLAKFDDVRIDLQTCLYDLGDAIDKAEDRMADCIRAFQEVPNEDLNQILRNGFIPGVRFQVEAVAGDLTFVGFATGMRVDVQDAKGESRKTDVTIIAKLMRSGKLKLLNKEA